MEQLNRIELRGVVGNFRMQQFAENAVLRLSLVTNYAYKGKDGAAVIDTSWHNVVIWVGKNNGDIHKIVKGSKLYVLGRVRYQKYTASDGTERTATEIVASRYELIESEELLSYEM